VQDKKERWKMLCEQAAVEQEPAKLLGLTKEINDLLIGKQHRLDGDTPPPEP
jgi:hypothetical protein